jgi:hypothetical protein
LIQNGPRSCPARIFSTSPSRSGSGIRGHYDRIACVRESGVALVQLPLNVRGPSEKNENASELRIGQRTQLINALRAHLAETRHHGGEGRHNCRAMSDLDVRRPVP